MAIPAPAEVVVGATKKDFVPTIQDANQNVVNLTGGSARLQGKSTDLPSVSIDAAGTLTDALNGVVTFASLGSLVTSANLTTAGIQKAAYTLRVKYVDAAGKIDFTEEFTITWKQTPV